MTTRKVLILGGIAGAYRSQNLIKGLLDHGHIVSIVGRGFYSAKPKAYTRPLERIGAMARQGLSLGLTVIETLVKAAFCDVIYLLPMNGPSIELALFAKRLLGKPLVSELYISQYDTAVRDGRQVAEGSRKARKYLRQDRLLITGSDIVVHIAQHELDYVARLIGVSLDPSKVRILPLAVEPKQVRTSEPTSAPGLFRICWWGTFIPLHGLDNILEAALLLKRRQFPFHLRLFGVIGPQFQVYTSKVAAAGLSDCVTLSHKEKFANGLLQRHLATECDLALGVFGDTEKAVNVVPNKVIDAFALQLPVLTRESPALAEFIDTSRELFTCKYDAVSIADAIMEIASTSVEDRSTRALAGYQRYRQTFTTDRYVEGVLQIIDQVTTRQR